MKTYSVTFLTTLLLVLAGLGEGCSRESAPALSSPTASSDNSAVPPTLEGDALRRGREIVAEAGTTLSSVLLEAMRNGGPTNALPLCSVQALPLTTSLAQANQVELRRVSHRPRNLANRATPQEIDLIRQYESALAARQPVQPAVQSNVAGTLTFYAPIVIKTNACLNCHGVPGDTLHPEIVPLLEKLYPADEATGFALGDVRGLWRVDFPLRSLAPNGLNR